MNFKNFLSLFAAMLIVFSSFTVRADDWNIGTLGNDIIVKRDANTWVIVGPHNKANEKKAKKLAKKLNDAEGYLPEDYNNPPPDARAAAPEIDTENDGRSGTDGMQNTQNSNTIESASNDWTVSENPFGGITISSETSNRVITYTGKKGKKGAQEQADALNEANASVVADDDCVWQDNCL